MGESAPERHATPEARVAAEEAEGVPLMLEAKGDLACRHRSIKISIQW